MLKVFIEPKGSSMRYYIDYLLIHTFLEKRNIRCGSFRKTIKKSRRPLHCIYNHILVLEIRFFSDIIRTIDCKNSQYNSFINNQTKLKVRFCSRWRNTCSLFSIWHLNITIKSFKQKSWFGMCHLKYRGLISFWKAVSYLYIRTRIGKKWEDYNTPARRTLLCPNLFCYISSALSPLEYLLLTERADKRLH